jgi:UDP-glucose 4-epimerase
MSPYGRHRVECERIVAEQHAAGAVLRVFSAYGEGLRRQVLFDICSQARSGRVLLGGNGTETRDFVHASDVARAVALAARNCLFDGTTYNVGTGVETSIERLAMLLVESLGWPAEIAFSGLSRPGDPDRWRADVSRMRALGFEPEVTIEDGAARYARWFLTA